MLHAKIYKPAKTAMQSGTAKTKRWLLEFVPEDTRTIEPIMGWSCNTDTKSQLKLFFPDLQAAIAYAKSNDIKYVIIQPKPVKKRLQAYADNFTKVLYS